MVILYYKYRFTCFSLIVIDVLMKNFTDVVLLGHLVVLWNCFTVVYVLIITGPENGLKLVLIYLIKGLKSMRLIIDS